MAGGPRRVNVSPSLIDEERSKDRQGGEETVTGQVEGRSGLTCMTTTRRTEFFPSGVFFWRVRPFCNFSTFSCVNRLPDCGVALRGTSHKKMTGRWRNSPRLCAFEIRRNRLIDLEHAEPAIHARLANIREAITCLGGRSVHGSWADGPPQEIWSATRVSAFSRRDAPKQTCYTSAAHRLR